MIYNLPVYMGYFDKYDTIEYLSDDMQVNAYRIAETLLRESQPIKLQEPPPQFQSRWDLDAQTIYYSVDKQVDYPILVSLKEYKTDSVLWSSVMDSMATGIEYWMRPGPMDIHTTTGVKLCIYKADTEEQLYEHPYVHKFIDMPTISLSNSIPYCHNVLEYFVFKKYDKWINRPYKLVIDAGANVGVFTSYMLFNDAASKIVAIECDSKALKDLQKNFKHTTTVNVVPKALSSVSGEVVFYHSPENPVISSTLSPDMLVNHNAGLKGNVITKVPAITLRELLDEYGEIDLLKVDIEGGEYAVFMNAEEKCFQSINNIVVECHFFESNYKEQYEALRSKLVSCGYDVEEYQSDDFLAAGKSECIFATRTGV
jgi:FkbM family methyltransferase